jgi:hypothetical protein
MLFHYRCVSVSSSVWKFVCLCVLSCIYCRTSYVVPLWVRVSEFICMKVCMFVCLVLYILSNVLCYKTFDNIYRTRHTIIQTFIQMVSCLVYIVERLMLFHYECVSVSSSVWKFVCLCVLSCIYCGTSYVVPLWVRVSEFICTNFHTDELTDTHSYWNNIRRSTIYTGQDTQTFIQMNSLIHTRLYVCVSCHVYIVELLMLFHYGCVSVSSSVWKFVWLCVLSCIYCRTSYVVPLWVCVSEFICMKVCMFVYLVLYILSNVLCC